MSATEKREARVPNVLDTREAAEFIGESRRTLEDWRLNGKGPRYFKNASGKVRYKRDVLEEYMDLNEVNPADDFDPSGERSA